MDKKLRAKLVAKLSADKKFDTAYSVLNREWFVGAVLDKLSPALADSALEGIAQGVVDKANARAKANRNFSATLILDPALATFERREVSRRVETIYGAIAGNPSLVDAANDALFDFIIRRRYRTAVRMIYYVNPNTNGIFMYPGDCDAAPTLVRPAWRVNTESKDLWERIKPPPEMVPLRVKVPAGTMPDPKKAAETLWKYHVDPCDSNLFDCAHGVSGVLMDSLFEAHDPDKLLKSIHARGPDHFALIHPNLFKETHYLWEKATEPKKVFSKEKVPPGDFQIGDHVYIWNHGIYQQVHPLGFWTGEHAIVVDCGNRKSADPKGFLFSGHGMDNPETVEALYDSLIKTLHTKVHRTYAIGKIFLGYRRSNNTSIPAAKVQSRTLTFQDEANNTVTAMVFVIDVEFKYGRYEGMKSPNAKLPMVSEPGFIVFEVPAWNAVAISPVGVDTVQDQLAFGLRKTTVLKRTGTVGSGGNIYDRQLWTIPYQDADSGVEAVNPFEVFGGPGGSLQLLKREQMPKFRFGRELATDAGAHTTRPTSDSTPGYVSFLKASGALAP